MYCRNCGTQIADDTKFCPECGVAQSDVGTTAKLGEAKEKPKEKSVALAVVGNLLIAGLGMAYLRQYTKAVLSFLIVW